MTTKSDPPTSNQRRTPRWLLISWILVFPATAALAGRLIYEMTLLTHQRGLQMVGFSLAHTGPIIPLMLSTILCVVWTIVDFVVLIRYTSQRRPISKIHFVLSLTTALTLGSFLVPYGFWRYVTIATIGPGTHAADLLVAASVEGSKSCVKLLLDQGIDVNVKGRENRTALIGASSGGHADLVQFLLSKGADLHAQTVYGDNALTSAADQGHLDLVRSLIRKGALPVYLGRFDFDPDSTDDRALSRFFEREANARRASSRYSAAIDSVVHADIRRLDSEFLPDIK